MRPIVVVGHCAACRKGIKWPKPEGWQRRELYIKCACGKLNFCTIDPLRVPLLDAREGEEFSS